MIKSKKFILSFVLLFAIVLGFSLIFYKVRAVENQNISEYADEALLITNFEDRYGLELNGGRKLLFTVDDKSHDAIVSGFYDNNANTPLNIIYIPKYVKISDSLVYVVKQIGDNAFANKTSFTETIDIADTIEIIGEGAFEGVDDLKNVIFNVKESNLETIKANAFHKCTSLSNITFPNKLKEIENNAFDEATSLKTIKLNDNLKRIGNQAFINCKLIVVNFGKSIEYIGDEAFNIGTLSYVYFPDNAPEFGNNVFYTNDGGKELIIYREITSTKWDSDFDYLKSDGNFAVEKDDTSELKYYKISTSNFNILEFNPNYTLQENEPVDGYTSTDIQGVTYRFYTLNSSLNSKHFAEVIGFKDVKEDYTTVTIPDEVIYDNITYKIDKINHKLEGSNVVTKVVLGTFVLEICDEAFVNCPNINTLCCMHDDTILGKNIFNSSVENYEIILNIKEDNETNEIYKPYKPYIYNHNVLNTSHIDVNGILYSLHEDYAVVGNDIDDENANTSGFKGTNAVIPDYVSLGNKFLKVVSLGDYAFYNNQTLESLELNAFIGKYKVLEKNSNNELEEVEINGLSDSTFRNCTSLVGFAVDERNVEYASTDEDLVVDFQSGCYLVEKKFAGNKWNVTKIIKASVDVTKFIIDSEHLQAIENYAFANCYKLTDVALCRDVEVKVDDDEYITLTYSVKMIGNHAFENTAIGFNSNYKTIDFSYVEYLGEYAFANCYYLEGVLNLPDFNDLKNYGGFPFQNCYSLKQITTLSGNQRLVASDNTLYLYEPDGDYYVLLLNAAKKEVNNNSIYQISTFDRDGAGTTYQPKPIRRIDAYAFAYSNLTEVEISDDVYIVGKAAFSNSNKLRKITFGTNVTYIGLSIQNDKDEIYNYKNILSEAMNGVKFNDVYVYEQEVFDNCYSLTNIKINNDNKYYLGDSNGILFNKDKTTLLVYPQGVSRSSYTIPSTVTMVALEAFENNTHLSRLIVPDGVTDIGAKAFNGCTNLQWIYFRSLNSPTIGEQTFNSTGALTNGFVVYCIPQPSVWYKDNEQMWRQFNVEKYNAIQEVPNESITTDMLYTLFVSDSDGNGLAGHVVTVSYKNNKQKTTVTDGDGYAIFSVPTGEALFDGNAINLSIVDPTEEYYDYNMNNFVLDLKTTFSFVTMISKPTVKGTRFIEHGEQDEHEMIFRDREISSNIIYVNKAALTYSAKTDQGEYAPKKVYEDGKWRYNYISTLCIQARVVWDQLSSPQKIEIVQSGHVVATYSFTDSSKNVSTKKYASYESSFVMDDQTNTKHESGTVIFELHPDLFEDNHEATIEIILYVESNGEIHPHKEDLNIRVFDFSLPFELNEYFSADGFSFKLDDSIPIIGNSSLNLEMDGMDEAMPPIWMYYKADKIVVTFNLDKIANLNLPDIETGKDTHYDSSSKSMREGSYSTMEETKSAIKDAIKDKKKLLETSKSHDFQLSLFGAIEISPITSNGEQFQVTNGSVSGILSYKFHISRTFVVIHIPVILQFEFSANGQFTFTLFNEESVSEGESVFADNPLEINVVFDVTIRGGVGCSIASVGVYGSIGLDLLLQFGVGSFIDKALFNINLGVYVQAKLGFIKVDGKINLYNKTIPIYVDEDLQHKQLKYKRVNSLGEVEEYNTIEGVINAEIIENDGSWQISNSNYNLYPINSKVVEYKGKLYKFYIDDVYANPVFDNESLYNDLNYLKLVYCEQIKDENGNNIWSDPKIVNLNSINNELEFDVIVDEFGIHIVYTRVKDVITIEGDLNTENVLSNLEVCLLTLNESNKYNSNPSIISGNSDNYMYSPQVYSINKHINVTWVENSEHSIYGVGSSMKDDGSEQLVHTTANSLVVYDAYQELHVYDNLGPVISKDMCLFNNELVVLMITEDERTIKTDDGNEYTEKYLKSSIIDINSGKTSYIENYIINEELIESISLYDVFNVGGKYYVYDNSNIYEVTYDKTNKALYLELLVDNIGNSFEIVINDNEIKGILYIENEPGEKENTGSSNLYYRSYNDGTFGNPIKLTNLKANQYEMVTNKYYDEYVHGFNYYIIDGDVYFDYQYYQTYAEINTIEYEDGTIEHDVQNKISSYYVSDITKLAKDNDVVLENVIFDIDSVRKGNEFKLSVDVYNDSLEEITEITVNIHYNNEVIKTCVINETILPGENKTIDVIIKLDTIGEYYDFSISTNLEEEVQYLDNNRLNKIKVGYADLMMNVKYLTMGNIEYIFVMLQNIGSYQSESGKLYVSSSTVSPFKNYNVAVDTIYELEYGSLMPLEYKYYTIEINSVYFTDSIVTVFAKGETQDEYNYDNNISYVTINPTNTSEGYGYYSIKYMLDGESYKTISYELGDKINELEHPVEEGYTFKGWYNLPTKMPAYDVEVFGFFEKNTYSVTYKVDNINEYTDLYFYQDYVQIRNAEIKVGHTFSGWYTEDGDHVTETFEMPASDIILYGSFVKNSYNIEYYVNEEYYDVQSFEYGTDITEDMLLKYTKPIPEGHSISNWTNYPNKIEDRNYKVYATLTPNTYKVTYTIPGKNDLELVLPYGSIIDLNYEEKIGYSFSGWKIDNESIKEGFTLPAHDITLSGNYTVNKYKLSYNVNGKVVNTDYYDYDSKIEEYVYTDNSIKADWINLPEKMPAYDLVIYSTSTTNLYDIEYYVDGQLYKTDKVQYNEEIVIDDSLSKTGYKFNGWYDTNNIKVISFKMPANTVRLYGTYEPINYTVSYYIDNVLDSVKTYAYGSKVDEYVPVAKEGHSISAWNLSLDTMPAYNVSLYATTSKNKYVLSYYVDNELIISFELFYKDQLIDYNYVPEEGYDITEWSNKPEYMGTEDINVYANTFKKTYKLYYYVDNECKKSFDVAFDSELPVYEYQLEIGKQFSGWSSDVTTMPAHDLTLFGYTSNIIYKVIYQYDGLEFIDEYIYNTPIVVRQEPTKDGYTFSGWSAVPNVMPAKDIIVTGEFYPIKYVITYMNGNIEVDKVSYAVGETIKHLQLVVKEYEQFEGWEGLPTTMVEKDIVVYAKVSKKTYYIEYMFDGKSILRIPYQYGDNLTLPYIEKLVDGWYYDEDFDDKVDNISSYECKDLVLYGKPIPKKFLGCSCNGCKGKDSAALVATFIASISLMVILLRKRKY